MNTLTKYLHHTQLLLVGVIFGANIVVLLLFFLLSSVLQISSGLALGISIACAATLAVFSGLLVGGAVSAAARTLWQAIMHISPDQHGEPAPSKTVRLGQELIAEATAQLYAASTSSAVATPTVATIQPQTPTAPAQTSTPLETFAATNIPLPVFVLGSDKSVVFANPAALQYLQKDKESVVAQNVYDVLDFSFTGDNTLDAWLATVAVNNVTATSSWQRVRINQPHNQPVKYCDLAAYYNKDNPSKLETILVLFDKTDTYAQVESDSSFVAMSVHELRTPLTVLRGFIEAFQEELGGQLNPQMNSFMEKMQATAQQLTAFVNNILNVARVDDDQLELRLHEGNWQQILSGALVNLELRARVHGIQITHTIAPNLPTVGVDRLSIQEVINNLVDNAIKYSGQGKQIAIDVHLNKEGQVETTIQDHGPGMEPEIMSHLFTKFYRNHRNRSQVSGTGLGLYISKAIIDAHGGTIWVTSKPGEGSTFGFSLVPYTQLAEELKNSDNGEIVRGAHGWIKNHSLYRR